MEPATKGRNVSQGLGGYTPFGECGGGRKNVQYRQSITQKRSMSMKAKVYLMMLATVAATATMADTFQWVGNGTDNYWGTDANWSKISGDSERTKPDNADFAAFCMAATAVFAA